MADVTKNSFYDVSQHVTKNSFYDVSQWLTSQKTLARENSFFSSQDSLLLHDVMRKVVTKFQKLIRKGERRKICVKKVPLMVFAYLLGSQEERKKRVHCANTVSCMQPFSPGPCRFGLDSRQALKVSENMPFICDD
jgi:hypothetical protein